MLEILKQLKDENLISDLNYHFAKLIDKKQQPYGYTETQQNLAILLAALLSFHSMKGNTAVRLESLSRKNLFDLGNKYSHFQSVIWQKIGEISPLEWQAVLAQHIAFIAEPENKVAPMLFQNGLLYFYRYWQAEHNIAKYLLQAVEFSEKNANYAADRAILDRLFPEKIDGIDWQKVAVATALRKKCCVISGGPGTGKTTTVAKLLLALKEKQGELKIGLVAPTGKAATRLTESISNSFARLGDTIPQLEKAKTIHSLLGINPQSDLPKHHADNPLPLDLLVVDEASMIDLFIMEKLLNALKPSTRLILLGDKDQLASVEAGAIMGELGQFITQGYSVEHCDYLRQVTGYQLATQGHVATICDSLCHLRVSHRFKEDSGIGHLATEVNAQQAVKSWQLFANSQYSDLERIAYPENNSFSDKAQWINQCAELVVKQAVAHYTEYLLLVKKRAENPETVSIDSIFQAFQKVRFLAALRVTELGVERLNQRIAEALQQAKLVEFGQARSAYHGKPIIVTQNVPRNGIYNGDIGIILLDENGQERIYFDSFNEQTGQRMSLPLSRMPAAEPAYVMTVHKSQGSEFERTYFVLPLTPASILTKELIYTAITRAKQKFTLFGSEKIWKYGVQEAIDRQSGLKEQIINGFSR